MRDSPALRNGDFLKVKRGNLQGEKGLVVEVTDEHVYIAEWLETQGPEAFVGPNSIKPHKVHRNWVKVIDPPIILHSQLPTSSNAMAPPSDHAMKGAHTVIKDVQLSKATLSGLKVTVQFIHLNLVHPYSGKFLDYDDIVESLSCLKLGDYAPPKNKIFVPLAHHSTKFPPPVPTKATTLAVGGSTPMPNFHYLIPAWNPSS
ncbi:hypothetical protein BDZ94DRAFT_1307872 [Collybia nuda]|uniref:KOW domain-containing protein n=1 Tax=Collybia nuda TaxID=64659 RepID=A0A9P5Y797_9AGAR|nr:hypothetical protein BDZ94DRAFT_1307872 [Collybia nuda]